MKGNIKQLAILGGSSLFSKPLHVGGPNQGDSTKLLERLATILNENRLTNRGPFVREFEEKIADYINVKHCIAMCNGTIALEIAERAMNLKGEVIVPAFTFIATPHSLQWQEITPVFCDIDPITHNIDPQKVETLITPKTSAILGVHLWGRPCDIEALSQVAKKHNLQLLFDASHAFSNSYRGKKIGGFGDAEIFSFHATKFINSFEGGAVTTNNDELAEKIRLMQNFGFKGLDSVNHIGTNGKMNEVSAAMGLTSFESLDAFLEINKRNYEAYHEGLANIDGIKIVEYPKQENCNYQYIVFEIDKEHFGLSRDLLLAILRRENVYARRYFYPGCHRMEPYKSFFPNAGLLLSQTEKLTEKVICLPTGTRVNLDNIGKITELILFVKANAQYIADTLY